MEDSLDSHHEQGSTLKSRSTAKEMPNDFTSSRFASQSEEDFLYNHSEMSHSQPDGKSNARGRKRNIKAEDKNENGLDDGSPSGPSESGNSKSANSCKKKKKTEQYKHQVIIDQYGTFEYDKDPDGYKKARKRQQNRESALRARDKRASKMEWVETTLDKIKAKSTNLEKENLVLKAEKRQLQDQIKNLLSIITSFGQTKRLSTQTSHDVKRFKVSEQDELADNKSSENVVSTDVPIDSKDVLEWDLDFSDQNSVQLSPRPTSPEKQMLRLMRKDQDSIFNQDDSSYGDLFQKGMMLSLTIVMCMILCLTGFSISDQYYSSSYDMWTTCKAPRVPFEFYSTESKTLMSHPLEPHYAHTGGYEKVSGTTLLLNIWIGVFMIMMFWTLMFKKQQYFFYNLITSPLRRSRPQTA